MRKVVLREERHDKDYRYLEAYLDEEGALHIDGQDLGPSTAIISSDGEYEWFRTIAAEDVPRLAAVLGAAPGEGILDLLERKYRGADAHELERLLSDSGIAFKFYSF
jgi:hypothetical protein